MLTREEHTKLRETYASRQGSPIFALAVAFRRQLEAADVKRHFEQWRLRPESGLTEDDQKVLDEGGATFDRLREQHELDLMHELFECVDTAVKTAREIFVSNIHVELEAPKADAKPSKKKGGDA